MERKKFFDVFPALKLNDNLQAMFEEVYVTRVSSNMSHDKLRVYIESSRLIEKSAIFTVRDEIIRNLRMGKRIGIEIVEKYHLSQQYTGELVSVKQDDNAVWFTIKAPENIMKYCIEKGSIALDGISLTIAKLSDDTISVSMIPHTIKNTNFGYKKPGDKINLENDMVGKYIDKLLHFDQQETNDKHTNSTLTMEMLRNAGF